MTATELGVLYVDSNPSRAESIRSTVTDSHPEVEMRVAETCAAAEAACTAASVDCVVSRATLSDGDGVDLLATVDADDTATTVLYDEDHSPALLERVADAGIDEYVHDSGSASVDVLVDHLLARQSASSSSAETTDQPGVTATMDVVSDVVLVVDAEGTVTFASPAVEDVFGYAPDEVTGNPLTVLIPPTLRERHRRGMRRYLETGERTLDWEDVRLPGRHRDGHEVPLSISFNELRVDGDRWFVGVARDVTEQTRRERELERYEAMLESVHDGVYVLDESSRFLGVNEAYARLVGRDRDELLGAPSTTVTGESVSEEVDALQRTLLEGDTDAVTYETTLDTPAGPVPLEAHISLFPLQSGEYGRIGVVRDITERRRREQQLASLNEMAQALAAAETAREVCEVAVHAAAETLDLPISTFQLYDAETGTLTPTARTPAASELVGEDALFGSESDVAWQAYVDGTKTVVGNVCDAADVSPSATPLRSAMVLPVAQYGVFVTGETEPDAFTETDVLVADILVANVLAALERTDREETLRRQKAELESRTATLERVNRINGVIRELTRALTEATTREEIEQVVCTQLANADPYRFVWVGEQETMDGELVPRASAGVGRSYLDEITVTGDAGDVTGQGPAGRAIRTREPQVQNSINMDRSFEPWRSAAMRRGFRASIAIPLVYRETLYGVLCLYADEANVFDELEVNVLSELGKTIGFAINALERRNALVSDEAVELVFAVDDESIPAIRFCRETGGEFSLDTLVERSDGTIRAFFHVTGVDPQTVTEHAIRTPSIGDVNLISERDGDYRFETTLGEGSFLGTLLDYGAHPTAFTATPDGGTLTVELPRNGDIRAFLDAFVNSYAGAELVARRELDRPIQTESEFRALYRERLTERQEEVLRTAYFAGFFDWPRKATGEEVASLLGISQPTVNRHVRKGEYELFSLVFDGADSDV
ncbi:PAS domain S-box protein [Halogeometricum limi]|uniref:PAS domain S-box-containing protein n=1 Tax=Halogeometricum limi TaxID=555875 RepID=A0A1I6FQF2_9EURY|nr:PAS domain S-box protein [Halogeometricum limi]SFR32173.1 PAS domain S-box-containing protein [Halogeometricum limi]